MGPQGLKPQFLGAICGTTKVVPFQSLIALPASGLLLDQRDKETVGGQSSGQQSERAVWPEAIAELGRARSSEDSGLCQPFYARPERNLPRALIAGEDGGNDLLVFFGLKGAG
jgi:hypothetical protein